MIILRDEDLGSQTGMERAMKGYFADVQTQCAGTLNAMLDAKFLSCDWKKRVLILQAETKPWMANPGGILHGGITAAYLDLVMGLLCRYCGGGYMTPTLHMDVSYLRAGSLDDTLCIRAEVTKLGATVCYAVGSIYSKDRPDRLIATATGSYYVTRQKS